MFPPSNQPPPSRGGTKEDFVDALNEEAPIGIPTLTDKTDKEEKETKDSKEKDEESEEEEIKLVEEDKEVIPEEEDQGLELPARRQEILKKYPNVFKEFPYLEKAYYRDQQFTELFSSPEEAKELQEKATNFDKMESVVMGGSIEEILTEVKSNDPDAFAKIADNYLPTLSKVDPNAYYAVLGNVIKSTIISMTNEAKRLQNEDLQNAALLLNQFVFASSEFTPPIQLSKQTNPQVNEQEQRIQAREQQFIQQQFTAAYENLDSRVSNILKSTIERNIDPKESMSDYVRRNAVKDAADQLKKTIDSDSQFRKHLDGLWKRAFQSNFDKRSVDTIRSAYLSKAKTILPEVIRKTRNEALKDAASSRSSNSDRKGPVSPGRSSTSSSNSGKRGEGREIPRGTSTLDYLMED